MKVPLPEATRGPYYMCVDTYVDEFIASLEAFRAANKDNNEGFTRDEWNEMYNRSTILEEEA